MCALENGQRLPLRNNSAARYSLPSLAPRLLSCAIAVASIAAVTGSSRAHGQDDEPPVELGSAAEEVEKRDAAKEGELTELAERLAQAWRGAGEPPLLVLCGMPWRLVEDWCQYTAVAAPDAREHQQTTSMDERPPGERAAETPGMVDGVLGPFRRIGTDLVLNDGFGICQGVRSRLRQRLERAQIGDLLDYDALIEKRTREIAVFQQANEADALRSIFTELPTAYVLYVRISPVERVAGESGTDPMLLIEVEIKLPSTGRVVGSESFRARAGATSRFLDAYSDAIARALFRGLADTLERRATDGVRYTLKLLASSNDVFADVRRVLRTASPALGMFEIPQARPAGSEWVADARARFAGDTFELLDVMRAALAKELKQGVFPIELVEGSLTARISPLPPPPPAVRPRWQVLGDPQDPGYAAVRALLDATYTREGKPRVGVIVNRELAQVEKEALGETALNELGLDAQAALLRRLLAATAATSSGEADAGLDTAKMQDLLERELRERFGLQTYDPGTVLRRLQEAASRDSAVFDDVEMQRLLVQRSGLDIVVRGVGRRVDTNPPRFEYSFDVVRCGSGLVIANATESVLEADFVGGAAPLERLAVQVAAKLVDQMLNNWSPPRRMLVRVIDAPSQVEVFAVKNAFETHLAPQVRRADFVSQSAAGDTGVGEFFIEWEGDFDALCQAIEARKDMLIFDLATRGTTRDELTVRIKVAPPGTP